MDEVSELDRFNIRRKASILCIVKDDDDLPMAVLMVNPNKSIGWEIDKARIAIKPKYREMVAAHLAIAIGRDHETAFDMLFGGTLSREGYRK